MNIYTKNNHYNTIGDKIIYQNYHKHSMYTNVIMIDSCTYPKEYAERARQLGHGIISSVEHGYAGRYIESYELAQEYNLKFLFGAEVYFVFDRFEKDNTNAHMVLLAKNENGRKAINRIMSEASLTGFYYRPRIDYELLMSLPKDDVWVTTACFRKGTKVLTKNGQKNIEDIRHTDYVLNRYGEWEKVNYPTKIKYNGEGYKIKFTGMSEPIVCSEDHKFLTFSLNSKNQNKELQWISAKDLIVKTGNSKHICVKPTNYIQYSNNNILYKRDWEYSYFSKNNHKRKHLLPQEIIITPELMRLFGLFLGDGYISLKKNPRIGFAFNEKEYNYYWNSFIKKVTDDLNITWSKSIVPNAHKIEISSASRDLIDLFYYIFGDVKAETKYIPTILKHINKEFDEELVFGYLLADGYFRIGNRSKKVNTITGECVSASISKQLITDIKEILESLNIVANMNLTQKHISNDNVNHEDARYLQFCSKTIENINKVQEYNHLDVVNLFEDTIKEHKRNYIIFDNVLYQKIRIKTKEKIKLDEFLYCLNNDTHSFCCENVIVHNCLGGIFKYNKGNDKSEKLKELWKQNPHYEYPSEMLMEMIHTKFGDNFFLEVQSHLTNQQIELNKKMVEFSKKYNIEIIAGVDSHYIFEEDAWKRDYLQKSSGIFLDDEQGWFMDYPDGQTLFNRFKRQGVLSDEEIMVAIDNTNIFLEVEEYTSIIFNHDMKMPSALKYKNLSKEEKQQELVNIVKDRWNEMKHEIPVEQHKHYLSEIAKELDIIFKINHADYFLLNYEIIKDAVENRGGMITFSGRGSGPSFIVNHILGFTQIDRISSPITLYPERFLSTSRMSAGSLADIDFNCGNTPVFEQAQTAIMGDGHAYPMIAYGTQKPKAAWKMYCRAVDVPFDVSNEISAKIDEYETDLKYWSEDSGEEEPNVYDYIPEDLRDYFDQSKEFLGIISSASRHPCGNILFTEDIKEEFGLLLLRSKGGKETIVACCDGKWIEKYLMLKNDLLTVACVKLNYLLYDRVGIPYMSLNKLLDECRQHSEVWDVYEKGYVIGLNQVEKNSTKRKVMKYKPKNISELSALIAGIRPAFKSLIDKLINREHFEYGIPTLDKLLQTEELPESFILYQEQIMKILAFAGIPMGDCYTVIKSISKKRFEKIMHYKEQFMQGMARKLIEEEGITEDRANEVTKTIWGIIEDASAYGFNSSHSLSVSFDSLLAAYFKALYPIEFYEVYLNLQMERADKAKALLATREMKEAFGITLLPMRFGQDNRKYTAYPEKNALSNCLKSIKGFGNIVGEELFRLARHNYDNFVDLLVAREDYVKLYPIEVWTEYVEQTNDIDENINAEIIKCLEIYEKHKNNKEFLINNKPLTLENVFSLSEIPNLYEEFEKSKPLWKIKVNDTQIETLIRLSYFDMYGKNAKLLLTFKVFTEWYGKKQINKTDMSKYDLDNEILTKYIGKETKSLYKDIDFSSYIKEYIQRFEDKYIPLLDQLRFERELLEIPIYQNKDVPNTWSYVLSFKTYGDKVNTPYLILYNLYNGDISTCSINKSKMFRENPFGIYSIIDAKNITPVPKKKKVGDGPNAKWVVTDQMKNILSDYEVILRDKNAEINEVIKSE